MKKTIVISLGGSLIVPEKQDPEFLDRFKHMLRKFYKTHKFVIVCGGGTIARRYIETLKVEHKSKYELSQAGIRATRMNAEFIMQLFGKKEANNKLPLDMDDVKDNLRKNHVVICGALRFTERATSDTTAAKLANYLKTQFVNITNVKGLFTSDPSKNKNAKFIPKISWEEFEKKALAIKHTPGQHFVLDQEASILINKHKIPTYIIGKDLKNLEKVLKSKRFIGTLIKG